MWGNPFQTAQEFRNWLEHGHPWLDWAQDSTSHRIEARRHRIIEKLPSLRGKDLACWCSLENSCHADILLAMANKEDSDE
jgi:hypothetical protein